MKKLLKKLLKPIYKPLSSAIVARKLQIGNRSYAQEGEDRVLMSLLFKLHGAENRTVGFYVDVGAHHPHKYSNTYLFYKNGWKGLNIDAMPGSMKIFRKERPKDLNVESGVGGKSDTMKFFVFNEGALNTFDEELARARSIGNWRVIDTVNVEIRTLASLLDEYLPAGQVIDFLSVDVEGYDLSVLSSNDWSKYRPLVVLAETFGQSMDRVAMDETYKYMKSIDYVLYSKTVNTSFFVDQALILNK